tara:strand:+ start:362 stop:499 length:138 start_codon:yes stop_codon:yes gene_type:complete
MKKIEILVDEHDLSMLELLHEEVAPWEEESAALLRLLKQIVATND